MRKIVRCFGSLFLLLPLFVQAAAVATDSPAPQSPADDSAWQAKQAVDHGVVKTGVYVNGHWQGYAWLRLRANGEPCINVASWLEWGLASTLKFSSEHDGADGVCVLPPNDDDQVRLRYDARRQQLSVRIDQELMSRTRGDVPISRRDAGIPVLRLDYQLSGSQNSGLDSEDNERDTQLFAALNAGANWGAWRLRSNHTWMQPLSGPSQWEHLESYLQRDLATWQGKLLLGDSHTDDLLFDSIAFRGAQLLSQDEMLPDYLHAFSPVIRGIAQGNAEVSVRQNGVLFYHVFVAAGPFALYDVRPPGGGDIEVTLREADGKERVYLEPYTAMPLLVHSKVWKYALNAGRFRPASWSPQASPEFLQATVGHGLPLKFSLFGGVLSARGYQSSAVGVGKDLDQYGSLSLDLSHSEAESAAQDPSGNRFRMRYAKSFVGYGVGLGIDYQRYTGGQFRTLDAALERDANEAFWRDLLGDDAEEFLSETRLAQQLQINLKKNVGETGSVNATFIGRSYKNDNMPSRISTQLGATWNANNFDLDAQAGYTINGRRKEFSFQLSLSISLGKLPGNLSYGFTQSRSSDGTLTRGNSLSGSALQDYRLSYSLNQEYSRESGDQYSARTSYQGDGGTVALGYAEGRNFGKLDWSAAGSMVAYAGGLVLGQSLGDTIAIVDAPGYAGVAVDGQLGMRTNSQGRAIISWLTPYRMNRIGLDSTAFDDTIDYQSLFREVAPTAGAVVYRRIAPQTQPLGSRR
jgi:outer membrane usher protein